MIFVLAGAIAARVPIVQGDPGPEGVPKTASEEPHWVVKTYADGVVRLHVQVNT